MQRGVPDTHSDTRLSREAARRGRPLDIPHVYRVVVISDGTHLGPRARSRIAMAQQVGGAVALDAPASSVSYRRTTPWKEPLKEKERKKEKAKTFRLRERV